MAGKQLGILVTNYANREHIIGVVKAARKAGHPVRVFLNDEGVKFTCDPKLLEVLSGEGVETAVCDHMCGVHCITEKAGSVTYGSQYDNACMLHDSERVLVF